MADWTREFPWRFRLSATQTPGQRRASFGARRFVFRVARVAPAPFHRFVIAGHASIAPNDEDKGSSAMKLVFLLALTLVLIGCTRPGDHPLTSNCQWLEEDKRALNLQIAADRRHLRKDVETAEDVAIRWTDEHFRRRPEYTEKHNECMASLFNGVAHQHSVAVATVAEYRGRRDIFVDAIVVLSFGALYAIAAYLLARRIRQRFPEGEPGFWVMSVVMAFGVGLVGVMAGNLWSIVVEGFRLNSAHISYRMDRLPARQYWVQLYACSIAVFLLVALLRSRLTSNRAAMLRQRSSA